MLPHGERRRRHPRSFRAPLMAGGLRHKVPAGLLDAGFNSLGTFAVGVAAAQLLDPALLGVYAVFFTAYQLGLVPPMYLIYLPAEVRAVSRDATARMPIVRHSLRYGLTVAVVSLLTIGLASLVVWNEVDRDDLVALALTAILPILLMPAQAHVRRMFHIAGKSWRAATISGVQLAASVAGIVALVLAGVPDAWVPFGGFSIAAVVSLGYAIALAGSSLRTESMPVGIGDLVRSGRWLLVTGLVPSAAGFVIAALISHLAGSEALGYAEGARLVAQPMMVLGVGLNASLGPRSMEAGFRRDRADARRVARVFVAIIGVATLVYLAIAGGDWPWNPLARLIPPAYEIPGLAATTIVASALAGMVLANQRELYGGGYEKRLAGIEVLAYTFGVAIAAAAGVLQSFARPLSLAASNVWRGIHYQKALGRMYREPPPPSPEAESVPVAAADP